MTTVNLTPLVDCRSSQVSAGDGTTTAPTSTPCHATQLGHDLMGASRPVVGSGPASSALELPAPATRRIGSSPSGRLMLPEGAFIGQSDSHAVDHDDMVLQLRKDPDGPGYYAILSEYSRNGLLAGRENDRFRLTDDVLRMQTFYIEHASAGRYLARPLRGTSDGELVIDREADPSVLDINAHGSMSGARFHLRPQQGDARIEQIEFDGELSVTSWEPFRPERYYLSMNPGASDYLFNDDHNTVFSNRGTEEEPDYRVSFDVQDRDPDDDVESPRIEGQFRAVETGPGVFVMAPEDSSSPGARLIAGKLLVFFDLVNWKPHMTTNEALIIDPNDPSNVYFFYERHDRPTSYWALQRALRTDETWEHVPRATIPEDRTGHE